MIKPMGEQLVVKLDKVEHVTPGGIILAELNPEPADSGVVLATSINRKSDFKVGDHIKFNRYAGQEFRTPDCEEGETYKLIGEHYVFAYIDD